MRKIRFFLITLLISGFIISCPSPGGGGEGNNFPDTPKETWTVLIHFAVDNNIDYAFEKDNGIVSNYLSTLESIEAADVNNKIDIVVFFDGYNIDTQGEGWTTTLQDGYYHLTGGPFSADLVDNLGGSEINSGDLNQTKSFLNWAVTNYPADGYMYSIFNHGGGFGDESIDGTYSAYGIAYDDAENDCLSHHELGQAIAYLKGLIGHNVDLFYAYACLMGGMELAYELYENADYLLFSEASFPADYWSYEALQTITTAADGASALDIGKAFCNSAYNYFSAPAVDRPFTLSLIYLSPIDELASAVDDYAIAAVSDMTTNANRSGYFSAAISALVVAPLFDYYIDMGDYLNDVRNTGGISSSVKNYAKTVLDQKAKCVAYMKNYCYLATGISIFHNILYGDSTYPVNTYKAILGFGGNSWADYVAYHDSFGVAPLTEDSYEAPNDDDFTTTNTITVGGSPQVHTFHVNGDIDYIKVNLSSGTTYTIETHPNTRPITDTVMYLYNSSHTMITSNDDGGDFLFSKVVYHCTSSGEYFIRIQEFSSDTGDYTINVRAGSYSETSKALPQFMKKKMTK